MGLNAAELPFISVSGTDQYADGRENQGKCKMVYDDLMNMGYDCDANTRSATDEKNSKDMRTWMTKLAAAENMKADAATISDHANAHEKQPSRIPKPFGETGMK